MKIEITHDRMIRLVENLIKEVYPNFNKENALHMTWSDGDESYEEYYDPEIKGGKGIFARYWIWKEELRLNHKLFETLESYLGEDMTFVIDWFNKEFDKNAESVSY